VESETGEEKKSAPRSSPSGATNGARSKAAKHHTGDTEAAVVKLGTDPSKGLTDEEAKKRLEKDGPNELPTPEPESALKQFFKQFANPIVLTLLGAAVIAIINGASNTTASPLARFGDAIAIILIVALNAVLGYYQERRAEAALDALKKMQTPNARVRRGDTVKVISAREVVRGDVLELEAGDAIPSDARVLQAFNLAAQESALTGESMPVGKDARAELPEDAPLGDQSNMLFLGTSIVRGKGRAVVVATGAKTELGKLSSLMSAPSERKTPLEEKLEHFGKRILWACLALSALLFGWGMYKGEEKWHSLLLEAVSLAVAAIPEGLPAITTITLALGMQRMAKRGAIIRKLAAVETLGAATVICSDKTGTLTQNEMTVRKVYAGHAHYSVTGTGYDPKGDVLDDKGKVVEHASGPLRDLLATAALANNAQLERKPEGGYKIIGDPTEGALLTLSAKGGVPRESVAPSVQFLKEIPFDSDRKRMTVVTLDAQGREVAHTKGSADVLLPMCDAEANDGDTTPLDDERRKEILGVAEKMSGEALRVLAIARRDLPDVKQFADGAPESEPVPSGERKSVEIERSLTFLGLVGMIDPPRVGVKEAVATCHDAGVRAVMITGDHKLTAVAIARELGLWEEGSIALSGSELEAMSDEDLKKRVDIVRVFARVTAEQKLRIVRAFKQQGHIVAMTGDGVNDAPALREAHIGVAMGKDGTDVAREAADMVLADDNFATIVDAVREGRAIWRNIQKFIFFLLSSNMGLVVAVFVAALAPDLPALTALMILWINLVTNGLPALALGVDPPDNTQMMEAPRRRTEGLLEKREYLGIVIVGIVMGSIAIACYKYPWPVAAKDQIDYGRAIAFSFLALSPLFHAWNCRSATRSVLSLRPFVSKPLVAAVLLSAAIHLVSVLVPDLREVFITFALSAKEWLILIALSASIVPVFEIVKLLQRTGLVGKNLGPMSRR
jgi:Ca2+-transporting ATPase